jgi:uncharacterized protein (TIGR03083 family)
MRISFGSFLESTKSKEIVDHAEYCDALEIEVARFSKAMSAMPRDEEIATCPGWNVVDLAEHLGLIHRWAEELVRLRSSERIRRERSVADRDTVTTEWIKEGGERLVATLRQADPDDAMWAWGPDQHVRFWSRRQLHETLVHRMDLELAARVDPDVDTVIAIDAIDEYLSNIEPLGAHLPELSLLRGEGEKLAFRVRDSQTLWLITFGEQGFSVSRAGEHFDAEVVGSALDLLLVILRRREVDAVTVEVLGNRELLDLWLAHSAFE